MKKSNTTRQGLVKKKDRTTMWMSIFIIILMSLSMVGFALMSGGGGISSGNGNNPEEYPLQEVTYEGQTFWYAIRNSEQFVFETVDGYDNDLVAKGLATKIKSQEFIEIYVDTGFQSSDSLFIVEKALTGIKISYVETNVSKCESNTLVFTNNESLSGDCIKFVSSNEDAFGKANILTYHLIK